MCHCRDNVTKIVTGLIICIAVMLCSAHTTEESIASTNDVSDEDYTVYYLPTPDRLHHSATLNPTLNLTELYCEEEKFVHDLQRTKSVKITQTNVWERIPVGERASLKNVCLLANGIPLTRRCLYNATLGRAQWEDISQWKRKTCVQPPPQCSLSTKLNVLHSDMRSHKRRLTTLSERRNVTTELHRLIERPQYKLVAADVHYTAQIMHDLTAETNDFELSSDILSIFSSMMATNPDVLRLSAELNATNLLLDTFESYMDTVMEPLASDTLICRPPSVFNKKITNIQNSEHTESLELASLGVYALFSVNVSVFYVKPECANITGIAMYALNKQSTIRGVLHSAVGEFSYRFIYMHESPDVIMKEPGLEAATFVPPSLWTSITGSFNGMHTPKLVFKIYAHDALFVESALVRSRKPFSKILSISIPEFKGSFSQGLPFMLRNHHADLLSKERSLPAGTGCGYWNYDTWVSLGVETNSVEMAQPVILCSTHHLTQFSFLLGGAYKQYDPSGDVYVVPIHERVLDIISLVGCSLSLLGMIFIWLTAVLEKSWRALASTKVLLNLCVALTLEMFLFLFVNTDNMSEYLVEYRQYGKCIALGAVLQYSILVLFTWMLIVALLQFQRYVTVLGINRPKHYILKSALLAWGLPLLPTILVICIDPMTYIPTEYQLETNSGICYPSGYALTFGVILPVSIIVLINFGVFLLVFYNITHSLSQSSQGKEKKFVLKQVRLYILLFFLLGLSWIFGFFAYMHAGIVFSYLFCLTATFQGFVLFIYFVVLDPTARKAWMRLLCSKAYLEKQAKNAELQSMSTSLTSNSRSSHHTAQYRSTKISTQKITYVQSSVQTSSNTQVQC